MAANRKQSFMGHVLYILVSQVLIKLLGLVYRLVITNIDGFGDFGNGYYNAGYQVYTLLLAISSVGIPNAISKMVSERLALRKFKQAHRIFTTALILFSGIGLLCSLLMYFGADFIAIKLYKMDGVQYTLRALSPAPFFVCLSSVIRGYFLGHHDVKASGTSQILEQVFKSSLTIVFVILASGQSAKIMAAAANLATAVSTAISFAYLTLYYRVKRTALNAVPKGLVEVEDMESRQKFWQVCKSILWLSIPISLSSIITAFARVIDTATITRGIEAAFANGIPVIEGTPTLAQLDNEAVRLAGMYSKSDVLTNLPLALNIAFATVLVPSIASALALGNRQEAADKIQYSFLISILIVLPCVTGFIALAKPIFLLLYPKYADGYGLLQLASIALIFTALDQTICGSLQGIGKVFVPAIGLLCGVVIKITLNIILIRIPSINIYGAAISSIFCHFVAFCYCLYHLCKSITIKITFKKYLIKPLLANGIMCICAILVYKLVYMVYPSNTIACFIAIIFAVVCYFLLVAVLHILDKDELEQLPGGDKLYRLFRKIKLYK